MKATPRIIFGSFDAKHFHPSLMMFIRDREHEAAKEMIGKACGAKRLIDNKGSTLLHHAAKQGNEVITSYLISLGSNVNRVDYQGRTPLVLAVLGNYVTVTELLINASADIYVKFVNDKSLVQCVFDGTTNSLSQIIEMFINKVKSEYSDDILLAKALATLKCPLYYVMDMNNSVITEIMLENGCDINAQEPRRGNTALHRAIYFKYMGNIEMLLRCGADVNLKDHGGKIAWRCTQNLDGSIVQLKVLRLLLDRKPDLTSLTKKGRMQMYELFIRGSELMLKMILRSDIDLSGKDKKGNNVFHYLAMNRNLRGYNLLQPNKSYNELNMKNQRKLTALHIAAMNSNFRAIQFLLNCGAEIDAKTGDTGLTVLLCAIKSVAPEAERKKCVELLLEREANVQYVTPRKKTVFDMLQDNDGPMAKILLAHIAISEARGAPIVPLVYSKIENCEQYESQFNVFKMQLEQMKTLIVDGTVTLFDLLAKKNDEIEIHVLGEELETILDRLCNYDTRFDHYYCALLRKCTEQLTKSAELPN